MVSRPAKSTAKSPKAKKKKKATYGKESAVDGIKLRKARRGESDISEDEEDY
jgi:hypothetical protein